MHFWIIKISAQKVIAMTIITYVLMPFQLLIHILRFLSGSCRIKC